MATETVEFKYTSGLTLTASLFPQGSDTAVHTGLTCTEATNRKGLYTFTNTTGETGRHDVFVLSGTTPLLSFTVDLTGTAITVREIQVADATKVGGTTQTGRDLGAGVLVSVGTGAGQINVSNGVVPASGNWNTTTPPTVGAIATAVWQDTTATDFTTAHSIGKALFIDDHVPGAASGLAIVGSPMTLASGAIVTATFGTCVPPAPTGMSTLTQAQVSGGAYDLTNATFVAALKAGLGTMPASGNWITAGTGAGQLNVTGGRADSNVLYVDDGAIHSTTAGRIAANLTTMFDVAVQNLTGASVNQTGDTYGGLTAGAIAGLKALFANAVTGTAQTGGSSTSIKLQSGQTCQAGDIITWTNASGGPDTKAVKSFDAGTLIATIESAGWRGGATPANTATYLIFGRVTPP